MVNLVISRVCNMHCSYCFASQPGQPSEGKVYPVYVSLDTFNAHLDFLDRSGIDEVRLIGGEPTLHPDFSELVNLTRHRNKPILLFSHGLMPGSALACLESVPAEGCTVLVNMNATREPDGPSGIEYARRRENLQRLGQRALLGFNIYRLDFELEFLIDLIQEAGCQKALRLGLAHPVLSGQNSYLHPKQYPFVGQKIVQFAQMAGKSGIRLEFDCGFVRCMFSQDGLDILAQCQADVGWRCNPILDLDINNQAFHCFPLRDRYQVPVVLAGRHYLN
jgi:hypothetical protein